MQPDERDLLLRIADAAVELLGAQWGNTDRDMKALRLEIGYLASKLRGDFNPPEDNP